MTQRILTHPNNRKHIEALCVPQEGSLVFGNGIALYGIEIQYDRHLPERKIKQVWRPPAGGRFTEYDPEDEAWMKPLGLGRFEQIDEGPLFYTLNEPLFQFPKPTSWLSTMTV